MSENRVLIVDDDHSSRIFLQKIIEREGYQSTLFAKGEDALKELRKKSYDLIITDLIMEEMNGIEVLKGAKSIDPHIGVIILTGHASIQTAIEALRLGASDYLAKPINVDELRIRVKKALERQKLEKRLTEIERRITFNATVTTANHEINQPLTVILSGIDMLRMELKKRGIDDPKIMNYFSLIQRSGHRIASILRKLREISSPVIHNIPHGMKMIQLKMDESKDKQRQNFVLVIEDEDNLRQIIKDIFESEGFSVLLSGSAKEGIEIYKTRRNIIRFVLLDYFLPDATGSEVFRDLKMIDPSVKVVITSGFEYDEKIQEVLNQGALGFLGKPFDRDQIINFVRQNTEYQS
jgi:DNA-binding NtrC family response regulator